MGIERTDSWLEVDFKRPIALLKKHVLSSREEDAQHLYGYLYSFGMYSPNLETKETIEHLTKQNYWIKAKQIYTQYRNKWQGPDVPVYIFPIQSGIKEELAGVSFKDKMFLFLSPLKDEKKLESLIVHEYHHVCRLNEGRKHPQEYTILDSIVMEGFAEFAVTKYCGDKYNAEWVRKFSDEKLESYFEKLLKPYLEVKRTDRLHDRLLFGKGFYPELLGYSVGYSLIKKAKQKHDFSIKETFAIESKEIIKILEL